jgi:hypothetical protein
MMKDVGCNKLLASVRPGGTFVFVILGLTRMYSGEWVALPVAEADNCLGIAFVR